MADISGLDVPMFRRLSPERLAEVSGELERRYLAAGQVLFSQGDAGDELFIVREGCVAIFSPSIDQPGKEKPLRLFKAGDLLGEMALIDRRPRSLSARTVEPTQLLVLRGDSFRRLVRDDPAVAVAVMGGLNDRIRYTTEFLNQVRHWVGRMSAGKYKTDQFLKEMQGWVQQVAGGDPTSLRLAGAGQAGRQRDGQPEVPAGAGIGYRDETLATLAAEFAQMATQVREREQALQRQVEQLRIEIDEAKKQRQVNEIVDSDYFQSLKAKAATLRQKRE